MKCTQEGQSIVALLACSLFASCANHAPAPIPPHAVVGVQQKQLQPEFWIARESNASKIVLDSRAIAAQNARLVQLDPSVHDLEKIPQALTAADVRSWIERLSQYPDEDMFDGAGRRLERSDFDALMHGIALESVSENQRARYGLVVRRADLRTFPVTDARIQIRGRPGHRSLPGERAVSRHTRGDRP